MKKDILLILLIVSTMTILNAKENLQVYLNIICSNSNTGELTIKINSDKLNLSKDALQDNLGGYVDIPEDKYYLKSKHKIYYIKGIVKKNKKNTNQFNSYISSNSKNFLNTKELYSLRNSKKLKFIQKIDLEKNNKNIRSKNITTTNILNIYFDKNLVDIEYKKCKKL